MKNGYQSRSTSMLRHEAQLSEIKPLLSNWPGSPAFRPNRSSAVSW